MTIALKGLTRKATRNVGSQRTVAVSYIKKKEKIYNRVHEREVTRIPASLVD